MVGTANVIARFLDGKLLKGTTQDFFPNRPSFHLIPEGGGPVQEVLCKQLKAIFFVKSLKGNPEHDRFGGFTEGPASAAQGKKLAVLFKDGELICGHTLTYRPGREGFFLLPADVDGNNIRIYVLEAATTEIKTGNEAVALANSAVAEGKRQAYRPDSHQ